MLLALSWIRESASPLSESNLLPIILHPLERDPIFGIILVALLTWMFHSSLAMILLIMSLCTAGAIHQDFGLYLVMGANIGSAFPAVIANWKNPKDSRLPLANALIRFIGVILAYPFVPLLAVLIMPYTGVGAALVIGFHIFFNLMICLFALPFTHYFARLVEIIRPDLGYEQDAGRPRYIVNNQMDTNSVALSNSLRETLRMAEMVQKMLQQTIEVFEKKDDTLIEKIREQDNVVDNLYGVIKSYLARFLSRQEIEETEAERAVFILSFATNLEHIGDVIDKNLMPLAQKKNRLHHDFSVAGLEEIKEFHRLILDSIIQAQQVFLSNDKVLAQKMLDQKRNEIRQAEENATDHHIKRLRDGVPETMATSSLHLDIIRDFRRINTYACSVAYEMLKR
jgi:phosphate:Na+ symporter